MFYILSIAFQLAGTLILLLWSLRDIQSKIIDSYCPAEAVAHPDDDDLCTLKRERIQEIAQNIHCNRCAFLDLCIDYSIVAFADKIFNDCITFVLTTVFTVCVTWLEYSLSAKWAKRRFAKDLKIHSSKLRERGVQIVATDNRDRDMLIDIGILEK